MTPCRSLPLHVITAPAGRAEMWGRIKGRLLVVQKPDLSGSGVGTAPGETVWILTVDAVLFL